MSIKQNTQARRMAELTRTGKRRGLANLTQPPIEPVDTETDVAVATNTRANAASKKKTVIADVPNGASVTMPATPPVPGNGIDGSSDHAPTPVDALDASVNGCVDPIQPEPSFQERINSLLKELFTIVTTDPVAMAYLGQQMTTLPESPFTVDFQADDTVDSPVVDVVEEIEAAMALVADTILSLRPIIEVDAKTNAPILLVALESLGARLHQELGTLGNFIEDALETADKVASTFTLPVIQTGTISTCPGRYRSSGGVVYACCDGVSQAEYDNAYRADGYSLGLKDGVPVWLKMLAK
jgi:hypothetical protein